MNEQGDEGGEWNVTDESRPPAFPQRALVPQVLATGTFTYRPAHRPDHRPAADLPAAAQMVWSDELFAIFGFAPGEVVPTLALMSSHQDPQDRTEWDRTVEQVLAGAGAVSLWHRIIDTRRRRRTLLTRFDLSTRPGDGSGTELRGTVADLTERLRQDHDEEIGRAVARSSETRAVIDQAKGVLMATMDLGEEQAFELLRWHSSYTNMKLRDLAALLLQRLAEPDKAALLPRQRLAAVLAGLSGQRRSAAPVRRSGQWTTPAARAADRSKAVSARISPEFLPRTLVTAVEAAAVSISIADCLAPDWPLVYVNPAFEKLTGYRSEDIIGRNCRFLQGPNLHSAQATAIKTATRQGQEIRTVLRNYRLDGTAFWNELHLSAVRNEAGVLTHYIGYQHDISERVERELALEQLAYHDPVVDLPNEAAALRHLQGLLSAQDAVEVGYLRLSVLSADGEVMRAVRSEDDGDLLCRIAQRLRAVVGEDVFLASLRGGAFLVVADRFPPGLQGTLGQALTEPIKLGDDMDPVSVSVSVSVGSAVAPGGGADARELVDAARARCDPGPDQIARHSR